MIDLKLTVEEVNLIIQSLQELPYKVSAELIVKISKEGNRQFEEQNKPEPKK